MNTENNTSEKPLDSIVERDVLGQEKPAVNPSQPKAYPNRIFIALGVVMAAILVYWFFSRH